MKEIKSLNEISNTNYILKLGANWCNPCKLLDTFLMKESIQELTNNKNIDIYKIDVDNDSFDEFISEQNISSIPVMLFYKNNELKLKTVNLQLEKQIIENINRIY